MQNLNYSFISVYMYFSLLKWDLFADTKFIQDCKSTLYNFEAQMRYKND